MGEAERVDLLVIGGGINGAGIACDAAGRGLSVMLAEAGDLASATSSASSKLVHGGLRYLEHYQFALVRESLRERSLLLDKAPHLVHPMRFVLPHHPAMRPGWMIRLGLFLYDHLAAGDPRLPGSGALSVGSDAETSALNDSVDACFAYSDCWVDDSRLVVVNARQAADLGAQVLTRTRVVNGERSGAEWRAVLQDTVTGAERTIEAQAIVNAAGPWALEALQACHGNAKGKGLRLVKGSHLVVPKLYDGSHAHILQNDDGRIVFVIPYMQDFTLIGTTEVTLDAPPALDGARLDISAEEAAYLCRSVGGYLKASVSPADAVWSFAGIRPLYDDKAAHAGAVTREYVLDLDTGGGAPLLSVFGGKLTTYRKLAEKAVDKLNGHFPTLGPAWTVKTALPGGEGVNVSAYPGLDRLILDGLVARHGGLTQRILGDAQTPADLGQSFGHGLTAREVDYFMDFEWARTAEDVLWRRSKLGLYLDPTQTAALTSYMAGRQA